ncbi:MAG TPA: carbohydrate kinase family protein [Frankiaceae bacterium]|nr:carbohydrate kinase family protein [Frankiaceae bacterium]
MPTIRRPRRARQPRIVVLGDLVLDVVLAPARQLAPSSDVPGRVALVQGGSAANTARWAARLGARSTLISAVGRDAMGRSLVAALRADGVVLHVSRVTGARTGRIVVLSSPGGERSFVQDRGAAELLQPGDLRPAWFSGADVVHLPIYSLLGAQGEAGRRALALGRAAGAAISIDLASIGPLLAGGRRAARTLIEELAPDLLFATSAEAEALLGLGRLDDLLALASIVAVKRGAKGATILARDEGGTLQFDAATEARSAADTTGAGDAFDAGFLVGWLAACAAGRSRSTALHRAVLAGHRAAARQLSAPRPELPIG